jgi:hypothetical protein
MDIPLFFGNKPNDMFMPQQLMERLEMEATETALPDNTRK